MRVYNTLSGEKEPLPERKGHPLRLFVCGITPYNDPHIGNARTYMFFDIFARYLRASGTKLTYLQNITDIDDKIVARSKEEGTDWETISRRYEKIFLSQMKSLGIASVDMYARATNYIPEIVSQVKKLVSRGHAYMIDGDGYYFDLKSFPEYGKLSRRTAEQAEDATTRIDMSDKKRNRGDFALWKFSADDEPGWKTELGYGRPGWHIEDTAITEKFFGPQYEIHGGAQDLKFPHHEAEIAQQESASGLSPFVKLWMHAGFLTVGGEKMSKSLNNFVTIGEFLSKYEPQIFRMMVFMHHYRSPFDYSDTLAETAKKNLYDIGLFSAKLRAARGKVESDVSERLSRAFHEAMEDDMNTPKALAAIFSAMNEVQPNIWNISKKSASRLFKALDLIFRSLGLAIPAAKIPLKIRLLARKREKHRSSKQFIQSDALREKALGLGYIIEDTPQGPFIWARG